MLGNWRPISLLNVDRKILAKILLWHLSSVAGDFSAVLAIWKALERCRASGWRKYLLALDQAKAFDRVNHEYLWLLLGRHSLQGRFIDWLKTLYKGAESFPLVNGWVGRPFEVGSGVRQGCPFKPPAI
ncbi:unnamed protein product [Staurois parvus]|uniref:Reverse transcriptase domain-containing protein n=1 Tax=Staurois parvus TaxID=386267 RepID=A0ABN9DSR4_9NEOB|nr:unnamed protein product [Staurois parvus]